MNKIELIVKVVELIFSALGLVLIVFGWIIPYRQSLKMDDIRKKHEEETEQIRWKKELIDKQISVLYGPIYALIVEGDVLFSRILYQLGRNHIIPADKSFFDLPENEQEIWKHYVNTYKIPAQVKMVEILRNNLHLIVHSELPTCYKQFLDYALGWELLDNQMQNGVENFYEYHYVFNYPAEFNNYIRKTLESLLNEQAQLIRLSNKSSASLSVR